MTTSNRVRVLKNCQCDDHIYTSIYEHEDQHVQKPQNEAKEVYGAKRKTNILHRIFYPRLKIFYLKRCIFYLLCKFSWRRRFRLLYIFSWHEYASIHMRSIYYRKETLSYFCIRIIYILFKYNVATYVAA